MKILIDTHILLWPMMDDSKLKRQFSDEIEKEENEILVSNVSIWEIAIKVSIHKLNLTKSILEIESYLTENSFEELVPDYKDYQILSKLPFHHNDPFDRLIISQAINHNLSVISVDEKFKLYPVQLL